MKILKNSEIENVSGGFDPIFGLTVVAGASLVLGLVNSARIATLATVVNETPVPVVNYPYVVY